MPRGRRQPMAKPSPLPSPTLHRCEALLQRQAVVFTPLCVASSMAIDKSVDFTLSLRCILYEWL
jgi:hypothetical protein